MQLINVYFGYGALLIDNFLPAAHAQAHNISSGVTVTLSPTHLLQNFAASRLHFTLTIFALTHRLHYSTSLRLSLSCIKHNCLAWYLERTSSRLCTVRIIYLPKEMLLTNASRQKPNSDSFPIVQLFILGTSQSTVSCPPTSRR